MATILASKSQEEMYGIFAWNTLTCQDDGLREKWEKARPHVGSILGLSGERQEKVLLGMVSRWTNMFIKQRLEEGVELSRADVAMLMECVPLFFKIDPESSKHVVKVAGKSVLQNAALKLMDKQRVTAADVQKLREEAASWELELARDLELTKPQLLFLFRAEVTAFLEDTETAEHEKRDAVARSRELFGLQAKEANAELARILFARCRGCLVNAVADLLRGDEASAAAEMSRFALMAAFRDFELSPPSWGVDAAMKQRLLDAYVDNITRITAATAASPVGDVRVLEKALGITSSRSPERPPARPRA